MAKTFTLVLGVIFLVLGVAGFIPALSPANENGQMLLGIFQINTVQSIIHLLSGAAALAAVAASTYYIKQYLIVFGAVYALVALWGINSLTGATNNGVLFGLIHVNLPTELLHIAIAASTLYFGLRGSKEETVTAHAS